VEDIVRQVTPERLIEVQLTSEEQLSQAATVIGPLLEEGMSVTTSPTEAMVRFRTRKPEEALGQVLTTLIHSGIRVSQFREVQGDLEDTFLTLTRDGLPSGDRPTSPERVGTS
jgi:hypothetical protein